MYEEEGVVSVHWIYPALLVLRLVFTWLADLAHLCTFARRQVELLNYGFDFLRPPPAPLGDDSSKTAGPDRRGRLGRNGSLVGLLVCIDEFVWDTPIRSQARQ
jgi:hypothetical protein